MRSITHGLSLTPCPAFKSIQRAKVNNTGRMNYKNSGFMGMGLALWTYNEGAYARGKLNKAVNYGGSSPCPSLAKPIN